LSIWPTFEGHKGVTISQHVSLLFDLEYSNIVLNRNLGTVCISTKPDRTLKQYTSKLSTRLQESNPQPKALHHQTNH
jgi:hypothetical protein